MTKRLLLGMGLFSMVLFACAGDPNKQANDARNAELEAQRKQVQDTAGERSDQRIAAAEHKADMTEANAGGSSASQDRAGADAKMVESRDIFRAKATERLEKADARTSELKARVEKAGGKAPTSARDALNTVATQRSLVTRELDQLPKISNDKFAQAKTSLETQLDNLEGLVKRAADEVEKIKR